MNNLQNYQQYPKKYRYDPYRWPPDLGLAELHARCSEPGMADQQGVQCPCCRRWSKNTPNKWWKRSIHQDLKKVGAAIPGYFQLLIFYILCIILMTCVYSIYTTYAIYYTCVNYNKQTNLCVNVGFIYYLQFNRMINLLQIAGENKIIDTLQILQTFTFYVMLFCNCFSIFFITFHNKSARQQIIENKISDRSRLLAFYNINRSVANNFQYILKDSENTLPLKIVKKIELYQVKNYFQYYKQRNLIYYEILSFYARTKDQKKMHSLNQNLLKYHMLVKQQKMKVSTYSNKIIIMFEDLPTKQLIHKAFKLNSLVRWYYGLRTVLKQLRIKDFTQDQIKPCSFRIIEGSDLKWQNIGEGLGVRMASRIKAFFVCLVFIIICYIVLYYPMFFSLQAHSVEEQEKLNTFQKILPDLVSLFLVALSVLFRAYLNKLSQQRNPKDEVEKSRFILLASTIFHTIFFILMPIVFFLTPNKITNPTIKLYVISGQARVFMIIQLIIVMIDLPHKLWKSRQVKLLSNQKYAFRYNQRMLHEIVENPDYPLQVRVDIMLRFWSFAILYTFLLPFMLFYMIGALSIIYWIEKKNLYKHYSVRKRVSIRLLSEILIYFANFFAMLQCIIYSFNVQGNQVKILCAIIFTTTGIVINIIYWLILNKGNQAYIQKQQSKTTRAKTNLRDTLKAQVQIIPGTRMEDISEQQQLTRKTTKKLMSFADTFANYYHQFLNSIQNETLENQIDKYISSLSESGSQFEDPDVRDTAKDEELSKRQSSQQNADAPMSRQNGDAPQSNYLVKISITEQQRVQQVEQKAQNC